MGSGYGTALAREVVGPEGLVVAVEIDPATLAFARENLRQAGYNDVVLVHDDRGLGYSEQAPYDRICVTAACPRVPPPLIDQLGAGAADRARPGWQAPAAHPCREDRGQRPAQDPGGRVVRVAARSLRRWQRCEGLTRARREGA